MIKRTIVNSQRPQDFKRELAKAINTSAANADRLLRTESTGIVSATRMEQYKKEGHEKVMVLSGLTETTCSHCASYDHTIIPVSEVRIGINVPPLHPNCKCEVVPYVDEYSYSDEERAKDIERMDEKKDTVKWRKADFPSEKSYNGHYKTHEKEFPNLAKAEYRELAREILSEPISDLYLGYEIGSRRVRYDIERNIFVLGNTVGTITTMFKPEEGRVYYERDKKRSNND